jgi:hypothetical protein
LAFFSDLTFTQRLYLNQQIKMAAIISVFGAWVFTFILTIPIFAPLHGEKWFNKSALIWFEFLRNSASSLQFLSMALFSCVFLAIVPLRFGAEARFYRTRPLTIGFLFWSRVLLIVFALILTTSVGIAVAIGILWVVKGPVWQNLPSLIPRTLGPDDADIAQEYSRLLLTSAPRMLLSLLTTVILFFAACLAFVPSLGHLLATVQQIPAVRSLGPHPSFPALLSAIQFPRRYAAAIALGLCSYTILASQRWLILSSNKHLKLLGIFPAVVLFFPVVLFFLFFQVARLFGGHLINFLLMTPDRGAPLGFAPSTPTIALHYAFATAVVFGSWRLLRTIEL